jgi:translation elongation factor EF-Ts
MSEKTTIELIKELRTTTQAPMSDCKSALDECNNDIEKAIQ